ncbi:MAG: hypothetical protein ACKV2T_15910 [Kofleriaceae bacterium]
MQLVLVSRCAVAITCMLTTSLAFAERPTQAQARATALAWREALDQDDGASAATLTAKRFFAVVRADTEETPRCGATTATTAAARATLLACLAREDLPLDPLAAWTKKSRRRLAGPLAGHDRSRIAALERTSTLVVHHTDCVGQGSDVIVAVTIEKGARAPAVAAVFAQSYHCGE